MYTVDLMQRFGKIETRQIKNQVYDRLKSNIVTGVWEPGDRIPSENRLCRTLGVSRVSVRAALQSLAAQGFIEIRRGEGSFVKSASLTEQLDLLSPVFALDEKDILDVLRYRLITEPSLMAYVVENISATDITKLEGILAGMIASTGDMRKHARLDEKFHVFLTEIAANGVVTKIYRILFEIFNSAWQEICEVLGPEAGIDYHTRIIEALKARDTDKAEAVMRDHVLSTYERMLKHYSGD